MSCCVSDCCLILYTRSYITYYVIVVHVIFIISYHIYVHGIIWVWLKKWVWIVLPWSGCTEWVSSSIRVVWSGPIIEKAYGILQWSKVAWYKYHLSFWVSRVWVQGMANLLRDVWIMGIRASPLSRSHVHIRVPAEGRTRWRFARFLSIRRYCLRIYVCLLMSTWGGAGWGEVNNLHFDLHTQLTLC